MLAPPVTISSPQSTAIITWCYAVTMLRYARISPYYAALVYHHTALRWCITTLRCARISPHCATLVYPPYYALSRSCITTLRYAGVVLIAPAARVMPPAWLLLIPCTSARSTSCAAGTVSAARLSWPTRSSRNERPDRRRSQRGRSRAWRRPRRQTTAPAG